MPEFSLHDTLQSGQIFRFTLQENGAWVGHADKMFFVTTNGKIKETDEAWADNFLRNDQPELAHPHPYVANAINQTQGVRVLRQDPWECLVAFIISQNNHQKRIAKNVQDIARYGRALAHGFHAFPQPHELPNNEELQKLGLGYRAKHIAALRRIDLEWLYGLSSLSYDDAKTELMTLSGVGPKVADCILLFSLGFDQACPEDTWIKKVFAEHSLTRHDLGPKAGIIQQALFHYARTKKI